MAKRSAAAEAVSKKEAVSQKQKVDGSSARKFDRAPVNLLIDYQTLDQFFNDYATNISLGGVFIRSRNPLPVGTKLRVAFSLPGLKEIVVTQGEVAHVLDHRSEEGFTGMGISFKDLDDSSKRVIDVLVAQQMTQQLAEGGLPANEN